MVVLVYSNSMHSPISGQYSASHDRLPLSSQSRAGTIVLKINPDSQSYTTIPFFTTTEIQDKDLL